MFLADLSVNNLSPNRDASDASLVLANKLDEAVNQCITRVAGVIANARRDLRKRKRTKTFRAGVDVSIISGDPGPDLFDKSLAEDGRLNHWGFYGPGSETRRAVGRERRGILGTELEPSQTPICNLQFTLKSM